ncbi:hypothetical protein BGZ97_008773, partial [Linnemannia gamsii]
MQESDVTLDLQRSIDRIHPVNDKAVIEAIEDYDIKTIALRVFETIKNTDAKMDEIDRDPSSSFSGAFKVEADLVPTHHRFIRWLFADYSLMKLANPISRTTVFLSHQEILRVIVDHSEGKLGASPKDASFAIVVGRKPIYVKRFETLTILPPHGTRNVLVEAPVTLSVFQEDGDNGLIETDGK